MIRKNMKLLIFKLIFVGLFINPVKLYACERIIVLAGEWPPYISSRLEGYGIAGAILSEAFDKHGIKIDFIFRPWKRGLRDLKEGKGTCSPYWTKTKEREKNFIYSLPVLKADAVFFHLKSLDFKWNCYNDLKGLTLGGTLGYDYGQGIKGAEKSKLIRILRSRDTTLNFKMLTKKRVDLVPEVKEVGYFLLHNNFSKEEAGNITNNPKPYRSSEYYFIFSKKEEKNRIFADIFNSEIEKMKSSGKYKRILGKKWIKK